MNNLNAWVRFLGLTALVSVGATAWSQPSSTLAKIATSGVVVVAHSDSTFPFSYLDAKKQVRGYSIDICTRIVEALASELKKPLTTQYVVATGAKRLEAIVSGQADLECGSSTNTPQRREHVAFALSHYVAGARLLIPSNLNATKVDEMEGKKIATSKGTTASKVLRERIAERLLRIEHVEAESSPKAFDMLMSGQVDGFFNDDVLLSARRARSSDPKAWKIVDKTYTVEPMGIMFRRNDPGMKQVVDRVLKKMMASGELQKLYDAWFVQLVPGETQALELPMNALTRDYFRRPVELSF
ncbi:MAG: amino acid ABC transporter substrate-binding protein [Rhizobacter sp.]